MVTVVYNGRTLPNVYGPFFFQHGYENIVFRCNFLVKSASSGDLISDCNAIESDVRDPYNSLTVDFGGAEEYNFSHDDKTSLITEANCNIITDPLKNTETTRAYSFEFTGQLPADKSGFNFRRNASFTIQKDSSNRQRVTYNFEYTASASPDNSSRENFVANAEDYISSIESTLTAPKGFEEISRNFTTEHHEHITQGTIVKQEILDDETLAASNNLDLKDVQASYSVEFSQNKGVSDTTDFRQITNTSVTISYSAKVDKERISTNADFEALYRADVKPWLISHSFDVLGLGNFEQAGSSVIVFRDNHSYDPTSYRIFGSLGFTVPETITSIIDLSESITDSFESGIVFRKLWDGLPDTYTFWETGSQRTTIRSVSVVSLGVPVDKPPKIEGNFILLNSKQRGKTEEHGVPSSDVAPETASVSVFFQEFVELYLFVSGLSGQGG